MSILSRVRSLFAVNAPQSSTAYGHTYDSRLRKDGAYSRSWPTDEDRNVGAWERARLRLECMDQVRNNAVAAALVDRFQNYVVGPHGITPQAKTTDDNWNRQAEAYWNEWCKVADYRGRVNFAGLLRIAVASSFHSGECFFILTDNGKLQPVEAERVGTPTDKQRDPNVIDGVQVSSDGIVEGYHVFTRGDSGLINRHESAEFVPANNMIHYTATGFRFDQLRGTPKMAAVLNTLRDYRDYQDSTLLTARQQAKISIAVKTEAGAARSAAFGQRDATPTTTEKKQKQEYFGDLAVFNLLPNESVESFKSAAPGPQFEGFSAHVLNEFAARFGIPVEMLMLNFREGNFSQSKAALLTFYRTLESEQRNLRDIICQRVWNWKVAQAIKIGAIDPAPKNQMGYSDWFNVVWMFPAHEWIQPGEVVDAEMAEYRLGKKSLASITAPTGRDWEDILRDKVRERVRAAEIIKEEGGDKIGMTVDDAIDPYTNSQRPIDPANNQKASQ